MSKKNYVLNAMERNGTPLLHNPEEAYYVINGERRNLTTDLDAVKEYLKHFNDKRIYLETFEKMVSSRNTINEDILNYLLQKCIETYSCFNLNKYAHYTKNIKNLEWTLKNGCKIQRLAFFKTEDINTIVKLIRKYDAYIGEIPFERLPYEPIINEDELYYL